MELATQVMSGYLDIKGDRFYELQEGYNPIDDCGTWSRNSTKDTDQQDKSEVCSVRSIFVVLCLTDVHFDR